MGYDQFPFPVTHRKAGIRMCQKCGRAVGQEWVRDVKVEIKPGEPPNIFEPSTEAGATQSDDGIGAANGPEHSGLLEAAADHGLAAGFYYSRADKQVLMTELGIAHAVGIVLKVVGLGTDRFG